MTSSNQAHTINFKLCNIPFFYSHNGSTVVFPCSPDIKYQLQFTHLYLGHFLPIHQRQCHQSKPKKGPKIQVGIFTLNTDLTFSKNSYYFRYMLYLKLVFLPSVLIWLFEVISFRFLGHYAPIFRLVV